MTNTQPNLARRIWCELFHEMMNVEIIPWSQRSRWGFPRYLITCSCGLQRRVW